MCWMEEPQFSSYVYDVCLDVVYALIEKQQQPSAGLRLNLKKKKKTLFASEERYSYR